jgi:hypothetical protein
MNTGIHYSANTALNIYSSESVSNKSCSYCEEFCYLLTKQIISRQLLCHGIKTEDIDKLCKI